jgi:hypothetical protein
MEKEKLEKVRTQISVEVKHSLGKIIKKYIEIFDYYNRINNLIEKNKLKDIYWINKKNQSLITKKELRANIEQIDIIFSLNLISELEKILNEKEIYDPSKVEELINDKSILIIDKLIGAILAISNKREQLKEELENGKISVDLKKKYISELKKIDAENKQLFSAINVEYVLISYDDLKDKLDTFNRH